MSGPQGPRRRHELPLVRHAGFIMFRLRGTVLVSIWWQVLLLILYTTAIVLVDTRVPGFRMNFPDTLVDVLGVVSGLLLCFRTDSAFERYTEGRELWSKIADAARKMTREIWLGVREDTPQDFVEKISALNLVTSFAQATKHYLREEYEFYDETTKHLPKMKAPSSIRAAREKTERWRYKYLKLIKMKFAAYDFVTPTNVPIEISYYILDYIKSVQRRGLADEDVVGALDEGLETLVECLTSFERIQRTPIPLAYSVHLHHSVWIYLLALPFQMVGQLEWLTLPGVGLAAFAFLGILAIGWEIENPFGYDANDLPLDDYCEVIRQEIQVITSGGRVADLEEWMLSDENHPLAPRYYFTGLELAKKSLAEVENLMLDDTLKLGPEVLGVPSRKKPAATRIRLSSSIFKEEHDDELSLVKITEEEESKF